MLECCCRQKFCCAVAKSTYIRDSHRSVLYLRHATKKTNLMKSANCVYVGAVQRPLKPLVDATNCSPAQK